MHKGPAYKIYKIILNLKQPFRFIRNLNKASLLIKSNGVGRFMEVKTEQMEIKSRYNTTNGKQCN